MLGKPDRTGRCRVLFQDPVANRRFQEEKERQERERQQQEREKSQPVKSEAEKSDGEGNDKKMSRKTAAKKTSRARRAAAPPADVMPPSLRPTSEDEYRAATSGLLKLQSGRIFHVRRPSEMMMIKSERLPRNFLKALRDVESADNADQAAEEFVTDMPEADLEKGIQFAREMVCNICVCPRVEMDGKDGALRPSELDARDFWELFVWGGSGGPTLPIITAGGGVLTVGELESFHRDGQLPADEPQVPGLRWSTEPTPRHL